jgi:glutaryl-CoA dehydrogenase
VLRSWRLRFIAPAMSATPTDLFDVQAELTDDERAVRHSVRRFVDDQVLPIIGAAYRDGRFIDEVVPEVARLGLLGASLTGYGCAGMGSVAYGAALRELERGDSGLRSFVSVQGSLVMFPIWKFGSEAQKQRWLPAMATAEVIGCFGLTEPDAGSDPGSMRTRARADGDGFVLSGTKRWITNGSRADVALVWAKTDDDKVRGFLVERGAPGFEQRTIERKGSFRASDTAELHLDEVRVGKDALLPGTKNLGSALQCLAEARAGIAYGVLGAAEHCLQTALDYTATRIAFEKPLAGFQLVQQKLAEMSQKLTLAQLLALRLLRLKEQGVVEPVQISMAKMNNARVALEIARTARELLGANGITDEYPVMRHLANLETVITYEGTHDVHALVVGGFLTGIQAFR